MKIAVTYDNGEVFQHFGHCEQFKYYTVEGGNIVSEQTVPVYGVGHCALAGMLAEEGVDALICGGIGPGAQMALSNFGIQVYGGVQGKADEACMALVNGVLNYDPYARCSHHENGGDCGHHDDGCDCGDHDCGDK